MRRRPGPNPAVVGDLGFRRPRRVVNHMAWSHDGRRLAIGGRLDTQMTVLDVKNGDELPAPGEQFGGIRDLAYSPDGRYLAVSRGGISLTPNSAGPLRYTVSLWDARTAAPVQDLAEPDPREVTNMATHGLSFSSDARYLAVAYQRETAVYAFGDPPGRFRRVLLLPRATACAFRPGTASLACLRLDDGHEKLTLYRIPDGQVDRELDCRGHTLAWSPDGRWLVTALGPHVRVLDTTDDRTDRTLTPTHPDLRFHSLSFSADGRWCAGADHVRLELWTTDTWSHAATLYHQNKFIFAARFSPASGLLAAVGYAPVTIWNVQEPGS